MHPSEPLLSPEPPCHASVQVLLEHRHDVDFSGMSVTQGEAHRSFCAIKRIPKAKSRRTILLRWLACLQVTVHLGAEIPGPCPNTNGRLAKALLII